MQEKEEYNAKCSILEKEGNKFIEMFVGLESLHETGNKIGVANGISYVSWDWFQGVQRAYYHENRETMIVFLTKNFIKYKSYFNKLLEAVRNYVYTEGVIVNDIAELVRTHKDKCSKWIVGLCKLKKQYIDDENVVESLESIIEDIKELQHILI
jgi:hypothetical protein